MGSSIKLGSSKGIIFFWKLCVELHAESLVQCGNPSELPVNSFKLTNVIHIWISFAWNMIGTKNIIKLRWYMFMEHLLLGVCDKCNTQVNEND